MSESGCLKDVMAQNVGVEGDLVVDGSSTFTG